MQKNIVSKTGCARLAHIKLGKSDWLLTKQRFCKRCFRLQYLRMRKRCFLQWKETPSYGFWLVSDTNALSFWKRNKTVQTKTQKHRLPNESETSWKHTPNAKTTKKNDVCTVSRSQRDPLKHFEIAVLWHIIFAELRKIPIVQPNFTNEHVIWLF